MSVTGHTTEVELRYPGGWLRVTVPADAPICELLGAFLEVAELPDSDGWVLSLTDGEPCPVDLTPARLGSPGVVVLTDDSHTAAPAPAEVPTSESDDTGRRQNGSSLSPAGPNGVASAAGKPRPVSHAGQLQPGTGAERRSSRASQVRRAASRPVRARAEEMLPHRVGTVARLWEMLGALSPAWESREAETLGANDPELFTRTSKRLARGSMREAWLGTDYLRLLEAVTLAPYPERCQTIAVISPKGGVGKTAITALLGSLIAFIRRGRTIAVDTNPDFGSLGRRLVPEHRVFIDDLLAGPLAGDRTSPMGLAVQLGRGPDGLMVAPAPADRERAQRLDEAAYRTLFSKLAELAEILVLDCGTGLDSPAARAALGTADQLALVTDGEPDTASLITDPACKSLLEGLNVPVFLVANKLTARSRVDLGAFERGISFARGIVDVPHDQAGADSLQRSRFSWAHGAPDGWRTPIRELAALIAMSWPTRTASG